MENKGINVLSLFDGMSCGQIALERAGIKVDNYFASEIDKYAIKVTMANYPNTIQLGSVVKINTKTIYLSEVYSYICKKYFKNDIYSLQSIIPEWEMLHRIDQSQTFCSYFGTQEQINDGEAQPNSNLSINDRIWFYRNKMGDSESVFDTIRGGERGAIANNINVGELCKYSFWWNGYGQQEFRASQESFGWTKGIKEIGIYKTEIKRNCNKTVFNDRIERTSENESVRAISRYTKKEKLFNSNQQFRQEINGGKKEKNRNDKEGSQISENERIIQANYEANRISEINGIQLSIYKKLQVTIIECEWGVIIFKGNFQTTFGGSPCQSFSFAGKRKGMATKCETEITTLEQYLELKSEGFEFEGQSYLFWEYMRLLNEVKPKYFLLENVMMSEKWEKILTKAIGINPIMINSSLVSAQNRKRFYWTNIGAELDGFFGDLVCKIKQPKDKKILLKDILEKEVDEKYFLSEKLIAGFKSHKERHDEKGTGFGFKPKNENDKGNALRANAALCPTDNMILITGGDFDFDGNFRERPNGKSGTLRARAREDESCSQLVKIEVLNENQLNKFNPNIDADKSNTLTLAHGRAGSSAEYMDSVSKIAKLTSQIRRLTPIECERLQTVKDNYTNYVSDSQRYKMLGNGWTVDVIVHIFKYLKNEIYAE